jgi:TetR/AcrR family transcriptional regulator, regulator of cefoperazone and chloramphenicol sensitivity
MTSETRNRLLETAGEIFAERGFERATVREICHKAAANVAAVNYHFGDKRELYTAVFEYAQNWADREFPLDLPMDVSPAEQLRYFIRQFLRRLLDRGRPSWHGRLLAREMSEPTGALTTLLDREIRPRMTALQKILNEVEGELPPRVAAKCAASIMGQMLHYQFARPALKLISPIYANLEEHVEELADHIARFSLAGVAAIARKYQKKQESL